MNSCQRDRLQELYTKLVDAGLIKKVSYTDETLSVYDIQMLKEFETLINTPENEANNIRSWIEDAIDNLKDAKDNLKSALYELLD